MKRDDLPMGNGCDDNAIYDVHDTFRLNPRRAATSYELSMLNIAKQNASSLKDVIMSQPPSRERSLALSKLEEAMMWAERGIMA